jgi:hypothetical protein
MPTIKITDSASFTIETDPSLPNAIRKYFKNSLSLVLGQGDIRLQGSLKEFPVTSLRVGLSVKQPVEIGNEDTEMTLGAGVSSGLTIFRDSGDSPFPDHFGGGGIKVGQDQAYLSFDITPTLAAAVSTSPGDLAFGFDAGTEIKIANFKPFTLANGEPTLADALKETLNNFSLPGDIEDLTRLEQGRIITVDGESTLKFSAGLKVTAAPNPLATVDIPDALDNTPLKPIEVNASASVGVKASFSLFGEFQLRVQKTGANTVTLGYYRQKGSEGKFGVSASAGVSMTSGSRNLTSAVLKAISKDPKLDTEELSKAGLSAGQIADIAKAVGAGVNRNLELSLAAEFSALKTGSAAFLYEIRLDQLDADGGAAVRGALDGDLTGLMSEDADLPAGIHVKRSIFKNLRAKTTTLKVNLFGIFNFISLSKLIAEGTVFYDHEKGELIITDKVTAKRIAASLHNFAADSEKVHRVQMENCLLTAAYRGSKLAIGAPALDSTHAYFELHARTNHQTMKDNLDVAEALVLLGGQKKRDLLGQANDFGRSTLFAEIGYDDELITGLFVDPAGTARPREDYEKAGREALRLLFQDNDPDRYRQRPALDDTLWRKMSKVGSFQALAALFPDLNNVQQNVVHSDYLVVQWWAGAMRAMAEKVVEVRAFFEQHGSHPDPNSNEFRKLRKQFRKKIVGVAKTTKRQFGDPWGLVAMDVLAGRKGRAKVKFTGEVVAYENSRSLAGGASA